MFTVEGNWCEIQEKKYKVWEKLCTLVKIRLRKVSVARIAVLRVLVSIVNSIL